MDVGRSLDHWYVLLGGAGRRHCALSHNSQLGVPLVRSLVHVQFISTSPSVLHNHSNTSARLFPRATHGRFLLRFSKRQLTHPIHQRTPLLNTTRHTAIARRHIETRVPREEVPGSQKQCHWLCRHDGEVLGRGKVRDTKRVPEDNVGVDEVRRGICFDPRGYALRWLS